MNFHENLDIYVNQINGLLDKTLDINAGYADYLVDAMKYSVVGGGKRLRPLLMQECAKLFVQQADSSQGETDGNGAAVKLPAELPYFMAAIEFIHSYSLVHDDMPCLDNDEFRRGRKTTHAEYGEATALLAGDGLLNYAFEIASKAFSVTDDPAKCGRAMQILARQAGILGMIGGQAADVHVEKTGAEMNEDLLLFIHENKTAAMIESAMMIGACLAGADEKDLDKLSSIGSKIGLAFQIRDDILDIEGDFETFGKPIGSDETNGKLTYVSLYGLERSKDDVKKLSDEAIEGLKQFPSRNEFLEELVKYLIDRKK